MLVQFPKSVAILNFPRYPSNSLMLQLSKGLMSICEIESTAIAPACDTTSGKRSKPGLSRSLTLLFAAASGLAVANAYFAHPLLDVIADDLSLPRATIGFVVGATQLGYGLGLVLLVPVGDLVDRRKLVIIQSLLSVLALLCVGFAPTEEVLFPALIAIGFFAVATQAFVAYAASLARPEERGAVVGTVTSGIVLGILLARTVAGAVVDIAGWRAVYLLSAAFTLAITAILARVVPAQPKSGPAVSYPKLIGSLFTLFLQEPVLRVRGDPRVSDLRRCHDAFDAARPSLERPALFVVACCDRSVRISGRGGRAGGFEGGTFGPTKASASALPAWRSR